MENPTQKKLENEMEIWGWRVVSLAGCEVSTELAHGIPEVWASLRPEL